MINVNKIHIIIVTYNGMQWLKKCIESTKPYPVIIVDNNSTDTTASFIQENYPDIILLTQEKNLGFGQANNIGISYAIKNNADYVFLLNQDAYLDKNCIHKLIRIQGKNRDYGILSPIHLNGDGTKLDKNFSNYVNYNANSNFYSDYILPKREVNTLYEVPFVNAAGWLISKDCLLKVGGFDPIFFHYGEDDNFCQRVHYHNFKIGVITNSFILHDRANRVSKSIDAFTEDWLENKGRQYKIATANINKNSNFKPFKKEIKKNLIFSFLQLKLKNAFYYHRELKMLTEIERTVVKSRDLNKEGGMHYIN